MTSDKKNKFGKIGVIVNYGISIALALIFLYIAFYNVNFSEVLEIVSHANLLWVFIFIVVTMFGHYFRAIRWKYILNSVKPDTSMKNLFGSLMVGYGVNCVTPKLGEVTRAVLIGKWEGLSRSSMFGTVILERIIDTISLGLSVVVALFLTSVSLSEKFPWLITSLYVMAAFIVISIVVLSLILRSREKFSKYIIKFVGKISHKLAERIAYVFTMLAEGFASLRGTKNYFWTLFWTIAIILLYAYGSYAGMLMLDLQNIQPITFAMGWIIMSISAIGVMIPTPGSTGSYHTLAKSTLVLIFGFGETISVAYAFLTHIIGYILFIVTALIMFFIVNKQKENLLQVVETEIREV
ncbi:MAG: lysylphosphatidylglycerol synthase transmembrane domain-containing protein [Ignavibacteriaceae bacterium]